MNDLGKLTREEVFRIREVHCGNKAHLLSLIQGERPPLERQHSDWGLPLLGAPVYVDSELAANEVRVINQDGEVVVYIDGARCG